MGFKKEIITKLDKIETTVNVQSQQLAIYNHELQDHTKRSLLLEERIQPLEQSHLFWNKLSKAIISIMALLAASATVYHYYFFK